MQNLGTGGESRENIVSGQGARAPGPDGKFFTKVNDIVVKFSDSTPKGKRILEKAGFDLVNDYVLIQLMRHSSRSVGLDETVDLAMHGTEEFRAFMSDRIFRFTLNEHGYEWGAANLGEPELRKIGRVRDEEVIVLDRDGHDIELKPTDMLDLGRGGTEHLRTEKRLVTVFFENEPREIPRGTYTTEQLKKLLGVQEGYVLELINEEGQLTPLKPGAKTKVKDGMRFFEQVPCGGSS